MLTRFDLIEKEMRDFKWRGLLPDLRSGKISLALYGNGLQACKSNGWTGPLEESLSYRHEGAVARAWAEPAGTGGRSFVNVSVEAPCDSLEGEDEGEVISDTCFPRWDLTTRRMKAPLTETGK